MPTLAFLNLQGYGPLLIEGTVITITVGIAAMVVALGLGIMGALARLSQQRWLRNIGATYATVVRGIPELVLMLIVYYGGTVLLQQLLSLGGQDVRVDINAFLAGTLVLGFVYGAYATDSFPGAFLAIPQRQIPAALAFSRTPRNVMSLSPVLPFPPPMSEWTPRNHTSQAPCNRVLRNDGRRSSSAIA